MTLTRWLRTLARRLRVARHERRELADTLRDERAAAHVARQRRGIKDVHPGGAGF